MKAQTGIRIVKGLSFGRLNSPRLAIFFVIGEQYFDDLESDQRKDSVSEEEANRDK